MFDILKKRMTLRLRQKFCEFPISMCGILGIFQGVMTGLSRNIENVFHRPKRDTWKFVLAGFSAENIIDGKCQSHAVPAVPREYLGFRRESPEDKTHVKVEVVGYRNDFLNSADSGREIPGCHH